MKSFQDLEIRGQQIFLFDIIISYKIVVYFWLSYIA